MKFATVAALAVATSAISVSNADEMPTEEQFAQMTAAEREEWFGAILKGARLAAKAVRLVAKYGPKAYKYASRGSDLYNAVCQHINCPW